jgi:hypothetical protein
MAHSLRAAGVSISPLLHPRPEPRSVESPPRDTDIEADARRVIVPAAECFGVMIEFVAANVGAT